MTDERLEEILDAIPDDVLIDFATTCSNSGVAMRAEIELAHRYPTIRSLAKLISRRHEEGKV